MNDETLERPTMPKRSLQELLNEDQPAWPLLQSWLREGTNRVKTLPPTELAKEEALIATQVTTRSPMGAVISETGGLLIDYGCLRLLGSGHPRLPRRLPAWNLSRSWSDLEVQTPFMLITDDVGCLHRIPHLPLRGSRC